MRWWPLLLLAGCFQGGASPVVTPVGESAPVFPQVAAMVDGGRFDLKVNPTTFEAGSGATLAIPGTVSGTMTGGTAIVLHFNKPLPTGAAKRFGLKFSAGITRLEIEGDRVTAVTDAMGRRFTWRLVETPGPE